MQVTKKSTQSDNKPIECFCAARNNKDCINIYTPFEDRINQDQHCMIVARAESAQQTFPCKLKNREQVNQATHWLDLSPIYGSQLRQSNQLRLYKNGFLKSDRLNDFYQEYFTQDTSRGGECRDELEGKACFASGEKGLNQNMLVMSIATLWLREHNRLAKELKTINKDWNDETLFQEARKINIAQYQKCVYNEWLTIVIGKHASDSFNLAVAKEGFTNVYNQKKNPQIFVEFAGAAFRFGHSMVRTWVQKADADLKLISNITLGKLVYRPVEAFRDGGLDALFRGMLVDEANKFDTAISETLEDHLFEHHRPSSDTIRYSLGALNINSGRDHGLQPYNKYRKLCGLNMAKSFENLTGIAAQKISMLKRIYAHVNDIDLFTGGAAETPQKGALVGPTFSCIIS